MVVTRDADTTTPPVELKLHGLLAEYENVDDLAAACERMRDAGYTKWDAHTPFPVHGIEEAMGIRWTILPWIVLCGGLAGLGGALLMQWWMNAVDYPYLVSGKPYFSLPAFVPIMFELTVLVSALTAFFCVLGLNLLPQLHHPLFRNDRFKRATDDRFFISVEARDPLFDRERTWSLLAGSHPAALEEVMDEATPAPFPRGVVYGVIFLVFLSFIPLAFIARARFSTTTTPRIHLVWDMDWQEKYKPQDASPLFADGRAMRPPVPGTVARGEFIETEDLAFHTGKTPDGDWLQSFPIPIDEASMARGKQRYDIYCAPCHGFDGTGNGIVQLRVQRNPLSSPTWVPPLSYHSDEVRSREIGNLFQTITNGVRTMPAYGAQIEPFDRWAIILYVRALQRSQNTRFEELPEQDRARLTGK